jgi:acyl carrier protein
MKSSSRENITAEILAIVAAMATERGSPGAAADGETRLARDLGFSSLDVLQLLAGLDFALGTRLPYEQLLLSDSVSASDLSVGQLAAFAEEHFTDAAPKLRSM